jgi:murein DD-endopeptidase MepM/ murein hydrolase activator NlpD
MVLTCLPAIVVFGGLLNPSGSALTITTRSRAVAPGEIVIVTIASKTAVPKPKVHVFERDVAPFAVDERTWRVLVGIDIDAALGKHVLTVEAGAERATHTLVVAPKTFPTRRLTVDEAFVNPPESVLARIDSESKLVAATWEASAPDRLWDGPFVRPVPQAANSAFGTRSIFNGQRRSPHGGADFPSPAGTPVGAPNAGKVVLVRNLYYSGNTVIIDHGLGVLSYFAHLSETTVAEGDTVAAGVVVGKVGATGRVTGPHLHWTLRVSGARVDPLALLTLLGASAQAGTIR